MMDSMHTPVEVQTMDASYLDDRTHVLNFSDTFGIFSRSGEILPLGHRVQGIYHRNTRYVNELRLRINNKEPVLLSSNVREENEVISLDLTNSTMDFNGATLKQGSFHLHRSLMIRDGRFHEQLCLTSHLDQPVTLAITFKINGDFKDIFEVRGAERVRRGKLLGYQDASGQSLSYSYLGLDEKLRTARLQASAPFVLSQSGAVTFEISLPAKGKSVWEYGVSFIENNEPDRIKGYKEAKKLQEEDLDEVNSYFPLIETTNEQFTHWLNRSKADLISLMAKTPYGRYPYAGVPWYNTAFGRDGIFTALETLWIAPRLSRDVLNYLAACQAQGVNLAADAEPGKILHETRDGEMVNLNEVPFKLYYGTIDATPLFVMLAGAYLDRTADIGTIRDLWPNIKAALHWIDQYGDIDGDGFVEYQHKAANGLTNQGWKDSFDSVFHANGELAKPPIALCEVQAYVYAAKISASKIARKLQEIDLASKLEEEARVLKKRFNESFWDDELEAFVLALDGEKQPCRIVASNAGHALYSGIVGDDKAAKLVRRLLQEDMYTGWGVRTVSSQAARYNPMSYHNGSVWPHDVAVIASGMGRYGFHQEAAQLLSGMFDASLFVHLQRLPELFCGMNRRKGEGPTAYPVACSPQAWSVAAVFMMLQAILQVHIQADQQQILFHKPILPAFLPAVSIRELQLGHEMVDIELIRYAGDQMVGVNWNYSGTDWQLSVIN